jgi:hypothetical protein
MGKVGIGESCSCPQACVREEGQDDRDRNFVVLDTSVDLDDKDIVLPATNGLVIASSTCVVVVREATGHLASGDLCANNNTVRENVTASSDCRSQQLRSVSYTALPKFGTFLTEKSASNSRTKLSTVTSAADVFY